MRYPGLTLLENRQRSRARAKSILVLFLSFFFIGDFSNGKSLHSKVVLVDSRKPWTATGIYLKRGQRVTISASGKVAFDTDGGYATPDGSGRGPAGSEAVLPGAPTHGLLGRIGKNPPFFIGHEKSFKAANSGELFLGINETPAQFFAYADNSGAWKVQIKVWQ